MEALTELTKFMQLGARLDLKAVSAQHVLSLTGTNDGLDIIYKMPDLLKSLLILLNDRTATIAKDACLALVNISATEDGARSLLNIDLNYEASALETKPKNIVQTCLDLIADPDSPLADPACMILSNLTRPSSLIDKIVDIIESSNVSLDKLIFIFTQTDFNKTGCKLHYLGPVFSNLSQCVTIRKRIMIKTQCTIQRLLPFTEYKDSIVRRGGIVGTLRNCCFEQDYHEWLLGPEVDILPRLLLPLAGNEEFDDEDNDKLPIDLQYLPEDKLREDDPDIRRMLLEALTQLCTMRTSRTYIRDKNTYIILRELHKWDKDRTVLLACENIIDILIRTEEEIGEDNLQALEVPSDLKEKFDKMDQDYLNDT